MGEQGLSILIRENEKTRQDQRKLQLSGRPNGREMKRKRDEREREGRRERRRLIKRGSRQNEIYRERISYSQRKK